MSDLVGNHVGILGFIDEAHVIIRSLPGAKGCHS